MDVGVDHHQHQIVDPFIVDELRQGLFDRGDGVRLFGES